MMKVTVCIPTHNDHQTLGRAIHSIVNQTKFSQVAEIIVVDDGGPNPEAVYEVIEMATIMLGSKLKHVRITNRGLPGARNTALMLAKGEAFLPLDADDWIEPTYLEKTLPFLADADVVLTGLQEHGEFRNGCYMPGFDRPFDQVNEEILWQYNRFFYCSLFRTSTLRNVGGYNTKMAGGFGVAGGYEDWDLWIDLKKRNARFAAVKEPLLNYTTKQESMLVAAERNRDVLVAEMRRHHT